MSYSTIICVPCNTLVERLLNKRIRIILSDFDGYGVVEAVDNNEALVRLER